MSCDVGEVTERLKNEQNSLVCKLKGFGMPYLVSIKIVLMGLSRESVQFLKKQN